MKKTILFSALATGLIAFGFTSCNNKVGNANLKSNVDSASYAYGVMAGTDMAEGIKQYPKKLDINELFEGIAKTIESDSSKMSYELGMSIGMNMKQQFEQMQEQGVTLNKENFLAALKVSLKGDSTLISKDAAAQLWRTYIQQAQEKKMAEENEQKAASPEAKKNKTDGDKFLAEKAKEAGVQKTASGLLYKVAKEGKGTKPSANSQVKVNYKGTLVDGTEFDNSEKHGGATMMNVGQNIPGFTEGLQLMTPGSKYTFYIPSEMAYGVNSPSPMIQPNSVLVFDVELLEVDAEAK